jgi:hypothetical protein
MRARRLRLRRSLIFDVDAQQQLKPHQGDHHLVPSPRLSLSGAAPKGHHPRPFAARRSRLLAFIRLSRFGLEPIYKCHACAATVAGMNVFDRGLIVMLGVFLMADFATLF